MKKIILLILSTFLFSYQTLQATLKNIKALQAKNIPIVDIRTPSEWAITGVIPGAIKDTFFDEYGRINPNFLKKLKVKKFAIICRTGHRSKLAAGILENKGIEVIDLSGGIFYLFKDMLSKEFK